tara:strand:- start:372 stop:671 length:300 start_codon:yes stop_codon:yes gene_type:complete
MTNENKLIADFMGIGHLYPGNTPIDKLQYHTSWEWLMPVVEKIEEAGYYVLIGLQQDSLITAVYQNNSDKFICEGWGAKKKIGTYKAVVEFIKWYNENK